MKNKLIKPVAILALLIIWQLASAIIGFSIILPSPLEVLLTLTNMDYTLVLKSVYTTLIRVIVGFSISLFAGILWGIPNGLSSTFRGITSPLITVIRSTPVVSVILLALIWFKVDNVPIFVSFLMAFPIVVQNTEEGILSVDKKLLEMARIYNLDRATVITKIYIKSIFPYILSSGIATLGLSWKVAIAAEVISQPEIGIGTSLQNAKAFLETPEVFAWTLLAILLSSITTRVFKSVAGKLDWRNLK